jgi:transcriptional regulator with XRE-family HTH domain
MQGLSTIDASLISHMEVAGVPTLKNLRERTGLTAMELAVLADVSLATVNRMESGKEKNAVSRRIAYKVLNALGERLGERYEVENIEGLKIKENA